MRKLDPSASSVQEKRKLLGIPAFYLPQWTDEETAILGKHSDEDVATILGRSVEVVRLLVSKAGHSRAIRVVPLARLR